MLYHQTQERVQKQALAANTHAKSMKTIFALCCVLAFSLPSLTLCAAHDHEQPTKATSTTQKFNVIHQDTGGADIVPVTHKGISFGAGEWSWPGAAYNTNYSSQALEELSWTGATHVKILVTWFQHDINSTTIAPLATGSALDSSSDASLLATIAQAKSLGLSVTLAPVLDLDWDVTTNIRGPQPGSVSVADVGKFFTSTDWSNWMTSFTAFVTHYAALGQKAGIDTFQVASGLSTAFMSSQLDWPSMLTSLKSKYSFSLVVAADPTDTITWWHSVDYIGINANYALTAAKNDSVAQLQAAWQPILTQLQSLSKSFNKPILFTSMGYQRFVDHAA